MIAHGGESVRTAMCLTRVCVLPMWLALVWAGGCGWGPAILPWTGQADPYAGVEAPVQNPLLAPVADREFLWNQVVDTVDDYFQIEREERVKLVGEVLTEGRIDTYPAIGSTLLEPWARDSSAGYERLHATLQSIRRRALVRVVPTSAGYLIHVAVYKEKEELAQPEHATVGGVIRRYDASLQPSEEAPTPAETTEVVFPALSGGAPMGTVATLGWIPLGRDISLEQRILRQLQGRLFDPSGPVDLTKK